MDLYWLKHRGTKFPVPTSGCSIGRSQSLGGLVLPGERVSRRHARIAIDEGSLYIEDLSSRNGTYVNGRRITKPTRLASGDVLAIGEELLEVCHEATGDTDVNLGDAFGDTEDEVATVVETTAIGLVEELVARAVETGEREAFSNAIVEMVDAIIEAAQSTHRSFGRNEVVRLEAIAGVLAGWRSDGSLEDWRRSVSARLDPT